MREAYRHRLEARVKARRARSDCETRLTWSAVTGQFSRTIEETHARYHRDGKTAPPLASVDLTLVLCLMDDESAAWSLDYLARLRGKSIRVLCLFTRYARIDDVLRARKHGFAYYRWNGTLDNALVIARSIVGRAWVGVLENGERLSGDLSSVTAFLNAQAPTVTTVTIDGESRFFHLRPEDEQGSSISYSGLSIGR